MISRRGARLSAYDPFLVTAHFKCAQDPYDPQTNPGGYVNFGTAENLIVFDLIGPLLLKAQAIQEGDTHYNQLHGAPFFREAIARFLSRRAGRSLAPDNIAVASGASAILENLAFVLCDPGEVILIPSPYYSGFDHDLALRSDAVLRHIPLEGPDFALALGAIEEAYELATSEGLSVRALLLNSPQNPLGQVYKRSLIEDTASFAGEANLHLILDEIYAESLMPRVKYHSGLAIPREHVHVVYGFAKDFGLSGYKVGVLHSEHREVIKAAQDSSYFYSVSLQTQRTLANLLDSPELDSFLEEVRLRNLKAYRQVSGWLEDSRISHLPVQGGIVAWLDLRHLLPSMSFEGERGLFDDILGQCRVSISPGQVFHCTEPGWFRLCFTVPESHRTEGLTRLTDYLRKR
jgi:1-aminocyclopropane-1-carboxylate synthase